MDHYRRCRISYYLSIIMHNIADMDKKQQNRISAGRKVDLRGVMLDEDLDAGLDEYVLRQKRNKRKVKRGEAAVELIGKGLKSEGIV